MLVDQKPFMVKPKSLLFLHRRVHCAGHSGSVHVNLATLLCLFSTEMAEIWSPATSYQDVFVYKISALYHLFFQSYKAFSGCILYYLVTSTKSFVTLKVHVIESCLDKMWLETKFQPFGLRNDKDIDCPSSTSLSHFQFP